MGGQGRLRLRGAGRRKALAWSVPGRVRPVGEGQPGDHRGLGRGAGGCDRREGHPAALQRHPPQGEPDRSGSLRGQPAPPPRPGPGGPVHQRAEGEDRGLQGHPGAQPDRAAAGAEGPEQPPGAAQPGRGGGAQEVRDPDGLHGVRPVRPAARHQQPARRQGVGVRLVDRRHRALLCSPEQWRGGGALRAHPGMAGDVGAEPAARLRRLLPAVAAQPRQEPAAQPDRPVDPRGRLAEHRARPGDAPGPAPRQGPRARGAPRAPAAERCGTAGPCRPGAAAPPPAPGLPEPPRPLRGADVRHGVQPGAALRGLPVHHFRPERVDRRDPQEPHPARSRPAVLQVPLAPDVL